MLVDFCIIMLIVTASYDRIFINAFEGARLFCYQKSNYSVLRSHAGDKLKLYTYSNMRFNLISYQFT
jgi:hypothetical protein